MAEFIDMTTIFNVMSRFGPETPLWQRYNLLVDTAPAIAAHFVSASEESDTYFALKGERVPKKRVSVIDNRLMAMAHHFELDRMIFLGWMRQDSYLKGIPNTHHHTERMKIVWIPKSDSTRDLYVMEERWNSRCDRPHDARIKPPKGLEEGGIALSLEQGLLREVNLVRRDGSVLYTFSPISEFYVEQRKLSWHGDVALEKMPEQLMLT